MVSRQHRRILTDQEANAVLTEHDELERENERLREKNSLRQRLLDRACAERNAAVEENERLRAALEEIERADAKTPVMTLNRIARETLADTGGEA